MIIYQLPEHVAPDVLVDRPGGPMGTLYVLTPLTQPAAAWCAANIDQDTVQPGAGYVVESRCVDGIMGGMEGAGVYFAAGEGFAAD
jgi:hypothetical protein